MWKETTRVKESIPKGEADVMIREDTDCFHVMFIHSKHNDIIKLVVLIDSRVIGYGLLQIQTSHLSIADEADEKDNNQQDVVGHIQVVPFIFEIGFLLVNQLEEFLAE